MSANKIYQVGRPDTAEGAYYALDCSRPDGEPYFEVYFKRTGDNPEHFLHDGYGTAKEACMAVDRLVERWFK